MNSPSRRKAGQAVHLQRLTDRYLSSTEPNVGCVWRDCNGNDRLRIDGLATPKRALVDNSCDDRTGGTRLVVARSILNDSRPESDHCGTLFCHVESLPMPDISPALFEPTSAYRASYGCRLRLSGLRIVSLRLGHEPTVTVDAKYTLQVPACRELCRKFHTAIEGAWCNQHVRRLHAGAAPGAPDSGLCLRIRHAADGAPLYARSVHFEDACIDEPDLITAPGIAALGTPVEVSPHLDLNQAIASLRESRLLLED